VAVLEIPIAELRRPGNRGETRIHHEGWDAPRAFPCIVALGHTIWGLTYRILELVLPRLDAAPGGTRP
jgi:hypothetical protein